MPEDTLLRLLNHTHPLRILYIEIPAENEMDCLTFCMQSITRRACCPLCGRPSGKVHSRYSRALTDLPLGARTVQIILAVRRFCCRTRSCPRKIFCERLGEFARAYARRTTCMHQALQHIGQSEGGRPGSRLAEDLGLPSSRMTLLRLVRSTGDQAVPAPTVVGVDDFAFRRGRTYGTILYDLERHQVLDLLPDRSAESLAQWLRARPGIRIISRDRGGIYAQGAREGAPQAQQVADRWHMVENLAEALARFLSQCQNDLRAAAVPACDTVESASTASVHHATVASAENASDSRTAPLNRAEQARQSHRAARRIRYETVHRLHAEGHTNTQIAAHLRMGASTVCKFLRAKSVPERAERRPAPTKANAFAAYVRQRWDEGCRDGRQLLAEVRERGYTGCQSSFYRSLVPLRQEGQPHFLPPAIHRVSPRHVASVLLKQKRKPQEQALVERLLEQNPLLRVAATVAEGFVRLVRHRSNQAEAALESWVEEAIASAIPALVSFARGLREDWSAVVAGLSLSWSNGPVEGAVNRLKMIKRQMFGRANFDLLRRRVLAP